MVNPLHGLELADLRRRTSMKWRRYPEDVLPMWVAEMDSYPAPAIAHALRDAIERGDTGYPEGIAYPEALAAFAEQRWGWRFEIEHTKLVPDLMLGAVELFKLFTEPGDGVVITPPVYPPFALFIHNSGLKTVDAPLTPEGRLDPAALSRAFAQASVFLLANPHNPTGTVHTRQELAEVARLAALHDVRVIADEIHAPLTLPGATFTPYLSVPGSERGFSLMSSSKAWNLPGLKAAVAIAGSDALADLARIPEEVSYGASHVGVMAHVAGLLHAQDWLDGLLSNLDENRRLLGALLKEHLPQVRYRMPEATYLTWLDCRELGLGDDPSAVFLERGRLAVNAGHLFGVGGAGHVRMNIATSPELIEEGVRRMARAV